MAVSVLGIVNLTPDSFFKESRVEGVTSLRARLRQIREEGADIIDLGACSTRPAAGEFVSAEEEIRRFEPFIPVIREERGELPLSIDTFRVEVAERAVKEWGAAIVNDVSGGSREMFSMLGRESGVGYVLTYNRKRELEPFEDMMVFFHERVDMLHSAGVGNIILDPGFGFSKSLDENYTIMRRMDEICRLDLPVMVGVSRKSMVYKVLDMAPQDALAGTTALHAYAVEHGAAYLRVHDVKEAVQTARIIKRLI